MIIFLQNNYILMFEFDTELYINLYPDLPQNGINNPNTAYKHWIRHGKGENRISNISGLNDEIYIQYKFDPELYRLLYPELDSKFKSNDLLFRNHLINGRYNRNISNAMGLTTKMMKLYNFDPKRYLEQNPELSPKLDKELFRHFLVVGKKNSNSKEKYQFDPVLYQKTYPNLTNLDESELFQHYLRHFKEEGRVCKEEGRVCNEKNYKENFVKTIPLNFFRGKDLTSDNLEHIWNNIDIMKEHLTRYKSILFICGDYPGYGGAATNCHELQKYFSKEHDTYSIFYLFSGDNNLPDKWEEINYKIVKFLDLKTTLKELSFTPDLVILKNFVKLDLKFSCPIYYFVAGIYKNKLNRSYLDLKTKKDHDKYINPHVLKQIKKSDAVFTNSSHTQKVLSEVYGIKTYLFYSSFVPFYRKEIENDPDFESRYYDYGLIMSDFSRPIKNADKSIDFLADKKNVILIGKNSSKYAREGWTCLDLMEKEKLMEYYKKIKYLVQDSHYESCSNVMVEGLMRGCQTNLIIFLEFNHDQSYSFKKNKYYIVGNITKFYNTTDIESLFTYDKINGYIIDNTDTKDFVFFIQLGIDTTLNNKDLYKNSLIHNIKVGYSLTNYSEEYLVKLYYLFGKLNIDINLLGLSIFYKSYINDKNRKFNKYLFKLIYAYYYGTILNTLLKKDNLFHNKNGLIISKLISGYGGVQKTTIQLIKTLDKLYNIKILSNNLISNSRFDFEINRLNDDIHHCLLVKKNNRKIIENYINLNNFEVIVNNKLNNILEWNLTKKLICICHNSMDPFNNIILKNQDKIDRVLTINNFHKNLLINKGFQKKISIYKNYINLNLKNYIIRDKFKYNIAFIGRLSKEKNVQLLIDSVNYYNSLKSKKINLYIIGNGENNLDNLNANIKELGKLSFDEILEYYNNIDYVISSSITEGKPFAIIEALIHGIPIIHSNINGINEIIHNNDNGFTFNLEKYDNIRLEMTFDKLHNIDNKNSILNVFNVLNKAYSISIGEWNKMSKNSIQFANHKYNQEYCEKKNINIFKPEMCIQNKYKIFINFKPNENIPYGGGNISVYYLVLNIRKYSNFDII